MVKSPPFVISRTFNAPRALVWKAWTERDRISQWWGPSGYTVSHCANDLRPDGLMHYCLRAQDGAEMWGKWTYREIQPLGRLVVVNAFSNKDAGPGRHPLAPDWPPELLSTFTFTEKDGNTTITVEWSPINATEIEQHTFDTSHESCRIGWTGTLDQLEAYLKSAVS